MPGFSNDNIDCGECESNVSVAYHVHWLQAAKLPIQNPGMVHGAQERTPPVPYKYVYGSMFIIIDRHIEIINKPPLISKLDVCVGHGI